METLTKDELIEKANRLKQKHKDFGIATDKAESCIAYLWIFHNIRVTICEKVRR